MNSESIGKLAAALAKAQGAMRGAAKSAQNPHLRSKYADLESCWDACRAPLADNEIAVIQTPQVVDGALVMVTTLAHSSGETMSGTIPVIYGDSRGLNPMQAMGSAITYARRYGLCALVGISPEDDDGATAGSGYAVRETAHQIDGKALAKNVFSNVFKNGVEAMRRAYKALSDEQRQAVAPYLDEYKALAEKADADVITEAQVKALKSAATAKKLNNEHIKAALIADGVIKESTKEIPKHRFREIMDRLQILDAQGAKLADTLPEIPAALLDVWTQIKDAFSENGADAAAALLAKQSAEAQAALAPHLERLESA